MAADLETGSLHEALGRPGFVPARGQARSPRRRRRPRTRACSGSPAGTPLLVERRVILDQRGRPIEATESRYPADRYALDVRFEVEDGARPRSPGGAP